MGWDLSQWLALGRSVQLLGSLTAVASHGYLTVRVQNSKHGLSKEIMVLELMACLVLGYSILAIVVQHTGRRSKKTRWLTASIVCDVVLSAVLLGVVNVLARAGLPVHCAGMTRIDIKPGVRLEPGFTTIGFSDESSGKRGELDVLCEYEHPYYILANALIFTYMFTITATVLRLLQTKYTKNTKVNELLESLERADDIRMKLMDSPSPLDESPRLNLPPPPSEGILTRNTSLRSNFTAATSVAASHTTNPYGSPSIPRRPIAHASPLPRRAIPPSTPTSSRSTNPGISSFAALPLEDDADDAEAALVADGMRHHQSSSLHNHQRHPSRDHHHHGAPFPRMPMLSEEDHHHHHQQSADAALVSDGMRPGDHTLPPYHPGNRRMSGHGGDNEMRLSGYVKGQTRAQDMKDSGRY